MWASLRGRIRIAPSGPLVAGAVAAVAAVLATLPELRAMLGQQGADQILESPVDVVIGPYLQAVGRTEATVCWETAQSCSGRLSWGPTSACPFVAQDAGVSTRHEVRLIGLRRASTTWYRVTDAAISTAPVAFNTEADRAAPLRVAVFGDTRTGHDAHRRVISGILASEPDLALHVGDLVESPSEDLWRTFFSIEQPLLSRVMLLPAIGNHEGDGVRYLGLFSSLGQGEGRGRYYTARWGSLAVVTFDSQQSVQPGSPQHAWAERTLAELASDPDVLFIVCTLHHGPFSAAAGHGSNLEVRAALVPLFEKYGVDIVFSGHDHVYERSTVHGVRYVITGGGGAPLHAAGRSLWTDVSTSRYEYCLVDIEGGTLRFAAFDAETGQEFDAFQISTRLDECRDDHGCSDLRPRTCPQGEVGQFRCVATTCIWNCSENPGPGRTHLRLHGATP